MNSTFVLQSTVEIILTVGFIWGLFNEHKLARIEKKLFSKIKSIRAKQFSKRYKKYIKTQPAKLC